MSFPHLPSTEKPALVVLNGGGDLVELLEHLLAQVKAGEVEGFVVATVMRNHVLGSGYAYHDDMEHAWARLLASVANVQHLLLTEGV